MAAIRTDPPPATMGSFGRGLLRAARLRCPVCGKGRVVEGWFGMKPRCPVCGIRTARESEDMTVGAMMFNIVFSELVLAVVMITVLVAMWPAVPWDFLQYAAPVLMIVAPFFFVPFSRTAWMAVDLLLHPVKPEELDPQRQDGGPEWTRR